MKKKWLKEIKTIFKEIFMEKKEPTSGELGEYIVCNYLEDRGFRIVSTNYRKKFGEIDIIAKKENRIHFVEVKTTITNLQTSDVQKLMEVTHETDFINLENRITPKKVRRLQKTIGTFLFSQKFWSNKHINQVTHETNTITKEKAWQFDIATVLIDTKAKKAAVKLITNVQI